MGSRQAWLAAPLAVALAACLVGGCGATHASSGLARATTTAAALTRAQALAYAHAVNLQAGDVPGFSAGEAEHEAPRPGAPGREYARCVGGLDPSRRSAKIVSRTFQAGRKRSYRAIRSTVEVWPTHADVAFNSSKVQTSRGRACLEEELEALRAAIIREPHGRGRRGPFRVASVPIALAVLERGFLTTINETLLGRSGALLIHIYRDSFVFLAGPAEVELEAVGFGRPVAASVEKRAFGVLLDRARANARA